MSPYRGLRGIDPQGGGSFGAPRTKDGKPHPHYGQDFVTHPGDPCVSPCYGKVVHIGVAYPGSDLGSVHIHYKKPLASRGEYLVKLLYVKPEGIVLGYEVAGGDVIGVCQNVAAYHAERGHKGMTNHVHLEVRKPDGTPIDPLTVVEIPSYVVKT